MRGYTRKELLAFLTGLSPPARKAVAEQLGVDEPTLKSIETAAEYVKLNPPPVLPLPLK